MMRKLFLLAASFLYTNMKIETLFDWHPGSTLETGMSGDPKPFPFMAVCLSYITKLLRFFHKLKKDTCYYIIKSL